MSGQTSVSQQYPKAAERFAAHALSVEIDTLPQAAIDAVKAFTLDTIGVGIGGVRSRYAAQVRGVAKRWPQGAGAGLWGGGGESAPADVAFVNAFQTHCQEFDCVHEGAVLHPFTVVIPVLVAEAQSRGMRGAEFIAAAAAGVDTAVGLGKAALSQIRFFRPSTCGVFGATVALARARRLSLQETVDAIGYALAFASGTMQAHVEGTPALAVQIAAAARSAFLAVDMAQAGMPGPRGALDGPFGYFSMFELAADPQPILDALGQVWRVSETSWKPFPTGRAAHGGIAMTLALRERGVTADNLAALKIEAPQLIAHLVGRPIVAPLEVNYARLCLPYVAAVALRRGRVGLDDFTDDALADPVTHAVAARVEVVVAENPDEAAFTPQRAVAVLRNGVRVEGRIDILPGQPLRPLTRDAQLAKFRACCAFGFGAPAPGVEEGLIEATGSLEALADAGILGRLASTTGDT